MIPTIDAFLKSADIHVRIVVIAITALAVGPAFGLSKALSIDQYAHESWNETDGLPAGAVLSIKETSDGYLWIGTATSVVRFDGFRFTPRPGRADPPSKTIVSKHSGRRWTGTPAGLKMTDGELTTMFTTEDGLSSDDVTALLEDRDDNLWIGTRDGVLHRLRNDVLERSNVAADPDNGGIFALAEDRSGALWVGTGRGLERYTDGSFTTFGPREGLANPRILNIEPRRSGGLYVLDGAGALYVHEDGRASIAAEEGSISGDGMLDLCETEDGSLWIGGASLHRFKDGHLESFSNPGGEVTVIVSDDSGVLESQTDPVGVSRLFHFADGAFTRVYEDVSFTRVQQMVRDTRNRLWIAQSGNGIVRMDGNTSRVFTSKDGLPHDDVFDVVEDPEGNFWVSTRSGLARIRDDRVTALRNIAHLPRSPRHLMADGTGHLFVTADDGIYRILFAELSSAANKPAGQVIPEIFTTNDGLKSTEISWRPSGQAKTSDGRIWYAGERGLSMIFPTEHPVEQPDAVVHIDGLICGDTWIDPDEEAVVSKGRERIEIRFGAPGCKNEDQEQLQFRYRLIGYDESWVDGSGRRTAVYLELPPGEYRFEAAARQGAFPFGKAAVLRLVIAPYWYETLWAKLSFAAIAALLLAAAVRLHLRRRNRRC